ncbi:MAG: hypothetical protein V3V22_10225 [Methylococcales bacterium]
MKLLSSKTGLLAITASIFFAGIAEMPAREIISDNHLSMLDANQHTIGSIVRVMSSGDRAQVALELSGLTETFIVEVHRNKIKHLTHPFVYFESQNCSGATYLSASISENSLIPASAIAGENQTFYISDDTPKTIRSINSILGNNGCEKMPMDIEVINAVSITHLAFEYQPPYTLELQ